MHIPVCILYVALHSVLNDILNYMVHKITTKIVWGGFGSKGVFHFFFLSSSWQKLVNLKGDAASHWIQLYKYFKNIVDIFPSAAARGGFSF